MSEPSVRNLYHGRGCPCGICADECIRQPPRVSGRAGEAGRETTVFDGPVKANNTLRTNKNFSAYRKSYLHGSLQVWKGAREYTMAA